MKATLHADGGARGNPGPAGIGVVLTDGDGNVLVESARGIGVATNNVAEYRALIAGLELALERGVTDLAVYMDSQLVVSQLRGDWKIRNRGLKPLALRARALMDRFERVSIDHVRRRANARADELANEAMDEAEASGAVAGDAPGPQTLL
jgi:probable phosphoglycerate mutase